MRSAVPAALFGALMGLALSAGASAQMTVAPSNQAVVEDMVRKSLEGIRIDKPVGGGSGPDGTAVIAGITLDDLLAMTKEAGVEKAEITETKEKTKFVNGVSNGVATNFYAWDCKGETCVGVSYYAFFGKQDEVDEKFVTAFNVANMMKLVRHDNGNVVLLNTIKTYGGVTREHMQTMTTLFVKSIKTVIDFKPS